MKSLSAILGLSVFLMPLGIRTSAGPELRPLHRDQPARNRGDQPGARLSDGRADTGSRRIGGGCGHRFERGSRRHRANDDGHGRGSLRHVLGREDREVDRPERFRAGAQGFVSSVSRRARYEEHAAGRHSRRHGSRRRGGLVSDAPALRETCPGRTCFRMRSHSPTGVFRFTKARARCGQILRSFTARKQMQNRSGCSCLEESRLIPGSYSRIPIWRKPYA